MRAFAANPRLFGAAKRRGGVGYDAVIELDHARIQPLGGPQSLRLTPLTVGVGGQIKKPYGHSIIEM